RRARLMGLAALASVVLAAGIAVADRAGRTVTAAVADRAGRTVTAAVTDRAGRTVTAAVTGRAGRTIAAAVVAPRARVPIAAAIAARAGLTIAAAIAPGPVPAAAAVTVLAGRPVPARTSRAGTEDEGARLRRRVRLGAARRDSRDTGAQRQGESDGHEDGDGEHAARAEIEMEGRQRTHETDDPDRWMSCHLSSGTAVARQPAAGRESQPSRGWRQPGRARRPTSAAWSAAAAGALTSPVR
ncbi:MAG: hypothetical protein QOK49_1436, partial [Baekduia sp.]|nr:hypothetical protein [Baekduia sp.]